MGRSFSLSKIGWILGDWAIQSEDDTAGKTQELGGPGNLTSAHLLNKHSHQACHHLSGFQRNLVAYWLIALKIEIATEQP